MKNPFCSPLTSPKCRAIAQATLRQNGKLSYSLFGASTGLVAALLLIGGQNYATAQSDNFDDGNDTASPAWTHYDPIAVGSWTFPGGNTYRIQASALLAARAGSTLPTVYSSFYISVDVVDWNDALSQKFGILARLTAIGLGSTKGYSFTYQEIDHKVSISRIDNETATDLAGTSTSITLDKVNFDYRLVFMGCGPYFEGRVYQLPDTTTPILVVTGTDSTYASGQAGLGVFYNSGGIGTADATFDNFYAASRDPLQIIDNFDDGNDTAPAPAWIREDPISQYPPLGGTPWAHWSFPGGNTYRLQGDTSPDAALGPGRAASVRPEIYTDFYVSADLVDWDTSIPHQDNIGVLARISDLGLGQTDGYLFTVDLDSTPDVDISNITDEGTSDFETGNDDLTMVHGRQYRFVFTGKGDQFRGRVFELPDTTTPLVDVTGTDPTYQSGQVGLVVVGDGVSKSDATFDNFFANIAEPSLTITHPGGSAVDVTWPVLAGLWVLQSTPNITPPSTWTTITSGITHSGGVNTYSLPNTTGNTFYRLLNACP